MMGALKLGVAVGLGYTLGGSLGIAALGVVKKDASAEANAGAAWAGRATLFVGLLVAMNKVGI
jgi:hypothetical protein